MKTTFKEWLIIISIAILIAIVGGVAGYFIRTPEIVKETEQIIVPSLKDKSTIDSFKTVNKVITHFNDSLKKRLSKYSKLTTKEIPVIRLVSLPCDSDHVVDSLENDIQILKRLVISCDTLTNSNQRFVSFLRNSISHDQEIITDLQYKIKQEAILQRKSKIKTFFAGAGTGIVLSAIAILFI